ncbi:MAG: hypothetical protein CMJ81_02545 [Planctomycetaceae bacterium]|nr:hypothetical protein [Planctomycetaceae bacterium]MBP61601.1 hypothetical protein [Planctomycetaceae bacterium]
MNESPGMAVRNAGRTATWLTYLLIPLVLGCSFFWMYQNLATSALEIRNFHADNRFFESDTIGFSMTLTLARAPAYSAHRHPFLSLMLKPLGQFAFTHFKNAYPGRQPVHIRRAALQAATLLSTTFLSFSVIVFFFICLLLCQDILIAVLSACFLGFSNVGLFLSYIPESFCYSLFFFGLSYLLFFFCLKHNRLALVGWITLSIISFGMTIPNIAQPGLCFLILLYKHYGRDLRGMMRVATIYAVVVAGVSGAFIYWQSSSMDLGAPAVDRTVKDLDNYGAWGVLDNPSYFISTMLRQFVIAPFLSPVPEHRMLMDSRRYFFTYSIWEFTPAGTLAVAGLVSLLAHRLICVCRKGRKFALRFASWGMLGCLLFNFILHSYYGWGKLPIERNRIDVFLYSAAWLFPMYYFLLPSPEELARKFHRTVFLSLLALTTLFTLINNFNAVQHIFSTTKALG